MISYAVKGKERKIHSFYLEFSMLSEGVACAKLLAEVVGQSVAESPPFANYLEDGY